MKYRELSVLLPCHSLEDFPLYHAGQEAESLLACWTALWHPALLAAAESAPKWHRVDYPPDDLQEKLLLVPIISVSQLPAGFAQRAKEAQALLISGEHDRGVILAKALEWLDGGSNIEAALVADFLALGYGYLQVQVLTRQMRYSSNLDEVQFFNQALAGAKAAQAGDLETARSKISACFDLLAEDRDHYYSVDAYLIDITLVAEQTLGAELRRELAGRTPINLLISGAIAKLLQQREPETHRELLAAMNDNRVGILGGEFNEQRIPLLSCENVLAGLVEGQRSILEVFERRVEVFGRRQFGLSPFLPGVLEKMQFRGALHATLDDGQFPCGSQIKTRWQGVDSGVVDAIAKPPYDASKPESFLTLAQKLGESMDSDHVATLCFAHWPGQTCIWYDDLKRCAQYTSALGRFITVEKYFADTYLPGHLDRFEANQYKSPYLRQDVIRKRPDPISSVVRYWQRSVSTDAAHALATLTQVVSNRVDSSNAVPEFSETPDADDPGFDDGLKSNLTRQQGQLSEALPRNANSLGPGYLIVNPLSFSRRIGVEVSKLSTLPIQEKPVHIADEKQGRKFAVVDVPPMGFVWLSSAAGSPPRKKEDPLLAEDTRDREGGLILRNEFMEVSINPLTGILQSLSDYKSRGNRLSQQLALRMPGERGQTGDRWRDPDELASYSVMAADEVRIVISSSALGEVEARGRLLDQNGQVLARFRQTWRLWRGSRVLELDIELDPVAEPSSDPWNSYYACRFAWSDEAAELYQSLNQTRQRVSKKRIDSPLFVEIDSGERRVTVLAGGLPYHRRVGSRMLDSLLVVRGERARSFRLGIGIDLNQPVAEAIGFLAPATAAYEAASAPMPANCWLFHIDGRSVIATHWSPLTKDEKVVGVRVRLLETVGRTARIRLAGLHSFTSARQVNFLQETISELGTTEGKVVCDLAANEWIEVEARWS
jgi:alpha-mannosidase